MSLPTAAHFISLRTQLNASVGYVYVAAARYEVELSQLGTNANAGHATGFVASFDWRTKPSA